MAKFISTQGIMLELPLLVDRLPVPGTEVPATNADGAIVGGGFFLAATVARQGIAACVASSLGTGPNSVQARHTLGREGVAVLTEEVVGDIGLRIVIIDPYGVRTTVSSPGVEAEPELSELQKLALSENDCVFVSLNDLAYPQPAEVLSAWVQTLPESVRLVLAGGPLVDDVDLDVLVKVLRRANLITLNKHQADTVSSRLGRGPLAEVLRHYVQAKTAVVLRDGARGAIIQRSVTDTPRGVPAFHIEVKDTTGVGDAHTGVLVSSLMLGVPLYQATVRANAAAALALSRRGYYRIPTSAQIDDYLAQSSS